MRVDADGTNQTHIGGNSTKASPFVDDGWVYFQGTDDSLSRVRTNGSDKHNVGGNRTVSRPFVTGGVVYFQGSDNRLWRIGA